MAARTNLIVSAIVLQENHTLLVEQMAPGDPEPTSVYVWNRS